MADASSIQWLTVTDFSGGIRQLGNADGLKPFSPQPVGSAAAVDSTGAPVTYDCIALPGGGIGPMPFGFTTLYTGPAGGLGPDAPNVLGPYFVGGLHIPQVPTMDATAGLPYGTDSATVFVNLNYIYNIGPIHRYRMYRYDVHRSNAVEVNNNAGATPFFDTLGTNDRVHGGFTPMCDYRSSGAALPTTPGTPYIIMGVCDPGVNSNNVFQYPRPGFTNRAGTYVTIKKAVHVKSHQGRLIVNGYDTPYQFNATADLIHNDDTFWTVPNQDNYDNGGTSSSLTQATVGVYGAMASASASELVIIRANSRGGMTVASDMNDPIITDYSGIQGTNGCFVDGCWTPIGYVYGTKEGSINVYVGGGQSRDIAPNMESGFWHQNLRNDIGLSLGTAVAINLAPPVQHLGKFAYHNGFIFVPGNWIYEIATSTWWRFRVPTDSEGSQYGCRYYDTSPFGSVYAAPSTWAAPNGPLIYQSDFESSESYTWQWTSQPIPIAKESEINQINEFVIEGLAQYVTGGNPNQLFVELTTFPNNLTTILPACTWATAADPTVFRVSVPGDCRGTHVSVKIRAVNTDTTNAAPIVLRFDLGLNQVSKVPGHA